MQDSKLYQLEKNFTFLLLACTILTSCSYDFSSDHYVNILPPSERAQYIELINFSDKDTINNESILTYIFTGDNNQEKITSEVYIDNQRIISEWEENSGKFTIYPSRYEDGLHTIRIEHTFSSGTGSIAEQAQATAMSEIVEYVFTVNRKPSLPPEIVKASIENGSIFIEWNKEFETDFNNAYLSIQFKSREFKIPLTEHTLNSGIYNDYSTVLFLGNWNSPDHDEFSQVTYSIQFEGEYGNSYGASKTIFYRSSQFKVHLGFNDFNSYKLIWSAHPLHANFESFYFNSSSKVFNGSSEGGEYIINAPYVFGKQYTVSTKPENTTYSLPYYTFQNIPLDNQTFGVFELDQFFVKDIVFNTDTNRYYSLTIEGESNYNMALYINEYSTEMEYLRKKYISNFEGVRHEYLKLEIDPTTFQLYLDARGSSYKIDANSLEILEKHTNPPATAEVSYRGQILSQWDYSNDQLTVTNTLTNATIYSGISNGLGYLSSTGKYIFIYSDSGNAVYEIVGDQIFKVVDIESVNYNYKSRSVTMQFSEDILFYSRGNQISIVNLQTKETKSFQFGDYQQSLQYDEISKKLLVSQNGNHGIYDTVTEEIISFQSEDDKQAQGTFSNQDRSYFMYLLNGRLIHSKGIYIDIK